MKQFKGTSLKIRLYLFVLVAFLPVSIFIFYIAEEQKADETDAIYQSTLDLAREAVNEENQQLESTRNILEAVSSAYQAAEFPTQGLSDFLKKMLQRTKGYAQFGIIQQNGQLTASSDSSLIASNFSDKPWFMKCLQNNELVIGQYHGEKINDQPILYFALPVSNIPAQTRTVIFAAVSLTYMNRGIFKRLSDLPTGSKLTLIETSQGMLSYNVDQARWFIPESDDIALYQQIVNQKSGTLSTEDANGAKWVYAFAPLESAFRERPISVILQVPRARALHVSNINFIRNLSLLIISALIAILSIWWVSNVFILKRLEAMARVSRDLAAGNLDARIGKFGPDDELTHLAGVFDEMATALQARIVREEHVMETLKRSREQLRQLAAHQQAVREEERQRIAREIHDQFGQSLTVLKLDLSWLKKRLPNDTQNVEEKINSMSQVIDTTLNDLHAVTAELRPVILDDFGLAAAIEWQLEEFRSHSGITCLFNNSGFEPELLKEQAIAVFRIFQEILTNIIRHAHADEVVVDLERRNENLILIVQDNGRGITWEEINHPRSYGLLGMRERLYPWNGVVSFEGQPDRGTQVTVQLPIVSKGDTHD